MHFSFFQSSPWDFELNSIFISSWQRICAEIKLEGSAGFCCVCCRTREVNVRLMIGRGRVALIWQCNHSGVTLKGNLECFFCHLGQGFCNPMFLKLFSMWKRLIYLLSLWFQNPAGTISLYKLVERYLCCGKEKSLTREMT